MPRTLSATLLAASLCMPLSALVQTQHHDMPGMDMGTDTQTHDHQTTAPTKMPSMMMHSAKTLIDAQLHHASSGTSAEPASTPTPMLMTHRAGWMLMLHGNAFLADTQQHASNNPTNPPPAVCTQLDLPCTTPTRRGGDKLFSANWIMPMAQRQLGPHGKSGQLTLRAMFSLEPATVTGRQYPLLFQQGETAFGKPIIDGQHPHNFFMELAALYDLRLGKNTLLSFYVAPIGDPAIGPMAFPHRASASENPLAALGHHQQDSTHIAFNVLTAGFTWRSLRFEQSGFHGGEPNEQRWGFQPAANGHALDSYASRLTFAPTPNWSSQYSIAHITGSEALHPDEDQQRQTASIMYNRPFGATTNGTTSGNWSTTLLWGRTRSLHDNSKENSYLAESLLKFANRNYLWTRIENAGRSSELLLNPDTPMPPHFEESPIGHVAAYTIGYDRDFKFKIAPHLIIAPGAQFTTYTAPAALTSTYGHHPFGVAAFIRFRLTQ